MVFATPALPQAHSLRPLAVPLSPFSSPPSGSQVIQPLPRRNKLCLSSCSSAWQERRPSATLQCSPAHQRPAQSRDRRTALLAEALSVGAGDASAEPDDASRTHPQESAQRRHPAAHSPEDQGQTSRIWEQQARMFRSARTGEERVYVLHRSAVLLFTSLALSAAALPSRIQQAGGLRTVLTLALDGLREEARRDGGWSNLARAKFSEQWRFVVEAWKEGAVKDLALSILQLVWKMTPPPIKWPIASFSAFYALVILAFGTPVARDLTPLWILGPVLLSYAIWQTQQIARVAPSLAATTKQMALEGVTQGKVFLGYAQSGKLIADTSAAASNLVSDVEARVGRVTGLIVARREALVEYVGEGKLKEESKAVLAAKGEEAAAAAKEWAVQVAEDFNDWFFIFRRRLAKLLAKVF